MPPTSHPSPRGVYTLLCPPGLNAARIYWTYDECVIKHYSELRLSPIPRSNIEPGASGIMYHTVRVSNAVAVKKPDIVGDVYDETSPN